MRRNTRGWGQKAESTGSAHLPSGQLGQAAFTLQPHGPRSSTTDTSRRGRVGVAVVCPALRSDIVPKVWTGVKVEGGVVCYAMVGEGSGEAGQVSQASGSPTTNSP